MSECSDIYAAIARLESKIDAIPRVNEQSITQSVLGQLGNSPIFLNLNSKVNSLGSGLDNLRTGQFQLGTKVNSALSRTDALGRTVVNTQNRIGSLQNQLVKVDQATNGLLSKIQQVNSRIDGVLAKISPLFSILGIVGALAGLASLAGIIYTIFPRLDAHDRDLDTQRQALSDNLSVASKAVVEAREANKKADIALDQAEDLRSDVRHFGSIALDAVRTSDAANLRSQNAIDRAKASTAKADQALRTANGAGTTADQALRTANGAGTTADQALRTANGAGTTADQALRTANGAGTTADQALRTANGAGTTADQALRTGNAANIKADVALSVAQQALNQPRTAVVVTPSTGITADQAALTKYINTTVTKAVVTQSTGITAEQAKQEQQLQQQGRRLTTLEKTSTIQEKMNQQGLEEIKKHSSKLENIGLTLVGLTVLTQGISSQTTPTALKTAAAAGTCSTLKPGGCMSGLNNNAAAAGANSAKNASNLERILNNTSNLTNLTLLPIINNKLGAQVTGGLSGFLQTAFKATRLDKIFNLLTFITTLHNAAMLSRNLGSTLGELTGQALSVLGIKDEGGGAIDINAEIGKQINELIESAIGTELWTGIKTTWNKANSVIASASQIVWTVRSLWDSSREVLEWTAENTGKIGNALKRSRVVGENSYRYMPEHVTHTNAWSLRMNRFRDGTENLDDAASSLTGVLSEVGSIQTEFAELQEQKQKFDTNIASLTPKIRDENVPVKDAQVAAITASKAPADAADVFRGEGDA